MRIAVTGATGFLGRHVVNHLLDAGHTCRCWHRPTSNRHGFLLDDKRLQWIPGQLNDPSATESLVQGIDAVVHCGLERQGGWNPSNKHLLDFVQTNFLGGVRLMQAARSAGVKHFVLMSTCAVHDAILSDRPLDETHPLWPTSHYGAHKAALEKFVHSFGLPNGDAPQGWGICALRPTGIYGQAHPIQKSKWFDLVRRVVTGEPVLDLHGGKEVHALDVAKAASVLLATNPATIAGQSYNCYDMYVTTSDVAQIAKGLTASPSVIPETSLRPKHQIDTSKLRSLGMTFGGRPMLEKTVEALVLAAQKMDRS